MLPLPVFRAVSCVLPDHASGRALHRRALAAAAAGAHADAEQWFEAAATSYRRELAVEALARLRVHQLMVRSRAGAAAAAEESTAMIEIVRRLNRLDRLESLVAPYGLSDARTVLAEWLVQADDAAAPGERVAPFEPRAAAVPVAALAAAQAA